LEETETEMQRQEEDIKVDLEEMGWKVMEWINLALNSYKWWEVMNIWFL